MKLNRAYLADAVFNHFTIEAVDFALLRYRYFSEVFKHQRNYRLGWRCCYDRPTVSNGFREVWKSSAVVKMEMCDKYTIYDVGQV